MRSSISAQSWLSVPPAPAMHADDRRPGVVLPGEERLLLQPGHLAHKPAQRALELAAPLLVLRRQLEHALELRRLGLELLHRVELSAVRAARSADSRAAARGSSQKPGAAMSWSSSSLRAVSAAGSKVITEPSAAGPRSPRRHLAARRASAGHPACAWLSAIAMRRDSACTSCRSHTSRGRSGRHRVRDRAAAARRPASDHRCRRRRPSAPRPRSPRARRLRHARTAGRRATGRGACSNVPARSTSHLRVHQGANHLLLDQEAHLVEHPLALAPVLDQRVLLGVAAQADALAHVVHVVEVLTPARVDHLQGDPALDVPGAAPRPSAARAPRSTRTASSNMRSSSSSRLISSRSIEASATRIG